MKAPRNLPHYADGRPMATAHDWLRACREAVGWYAFRGWSRPWIHDAPNLEDAVALRAGRQIVKRGLDRPEGDELPESWAEAVLEAIGDGPPNGSGAHRGSVE